MQQADEIKLVLNWSGFGLKRLSFSKQPPLEKLSEDKENIKVVGMR